MPELDNYTGYDNKDSGGNDIAHAPWYGQDEMAWVCNQRDDCKGFSFDKCAGHGGWFKNMNIPTVPTGTNNCIKHFVKKDWNWRKANNPDTSNPSILPRDQMATRFKAKYWGSAFDPPPIKVSTGKTCCGTADYPNCNRMDGYKVPLGWKWMITNDDITNGTTMEGYWDRDNMGWGDQTTAWWPDHPVNHGITNSDDCILAQNIGFDVPANWSTMVSKGIDPADALQIKHRWCIANKTNIKDAKCTNFYATPEAAAAGFNFDQDFYYMCSADPSWMNDSSCRSSINQAVKGSIASTRQQAKDLISAYCNTDAGKNQVDGICGCYNVTKYGGECLTTQKTIPGCRELNTTIGDLPAGAQVAFSDKFCASDVCVTQALGNNTVLLPEYTQGKQCPSIVQCVQDFRNANFQGSQVDASCKNTLNITGVPAPSPPAAPIPPPGTPPPPPGTPPPPPGTPPPAGVTETPVVLPVPALKSVLNTPKKQYAGIGGLVLFLVCCCIIILLMSSGGEKSSGNGGIAALLAAQSAGRGMSAGS